MATAMGMAPPPDLLVLDNERLDVLLDLVCADYVTASFASRENAKKVLAKALTKLRLSVGAETAPDARAFADDVAQALATRRAELQQTPGPPLEEDALAREVLKPKLLAAVNDMCKERDRVVALAAARAQPAAPSTSTSALPNGSVLTGAALAGPSGPFAADEIRMEGWLRKKGQHVTLWRERYFMIRSTPNGAHYLCYFRKKGEKDPRGWYVLGPGTTVDEVRESPSKIETKKLFTFRIRHLAHVTSEDVEDAASASVVESSLALPPVFTPSRAAASSISLDFPSSPDTVNEHDVDAKTNAKKVSSRRFRNRAAAAAAAATAATAVVLTGGLAGVGIGMGMGMSAAAAASAGAAGAMMAQSRGKGPVALAAESLETAVWWRTSILECIAQAEEQWKQYLNWYMDKEHDQVDGALPDDYDPTMMMMTLGSPRTPVPPFVGARGHALSGSSLTGSQGHTRARTGSFGTVPRSIAKTFRTSATFSHETSWKLYDFSSRLRVDVERTQQHGMSGALAPPPALRTSLKVLASAKTVFEMLMQPDSAFYSAANNHVIQDVEVLEEHPGDHSDVVYWKLAPTFLWPFYVEARELCLLRYWRKEPDGSYFICFQSTTHAKCPSSTTESAVKASVMGGGFIISPRVHADEGVEEECWVTLTIQMNPKGWIDTPVARSCYYAHAYGVYFLEMITAIASSATAAAHPPRRLALPGDDSTMIGGYPASTVSTSSPSSQLIVSETKFPLLEPFRTDLAVEHGLPTKFWSEPDAAGFFVRGPQYLSTRAKVPSERQALRLVNVELFKSTEPIEHIGLSSFAGYERGESGGLAQPYNQTQVLVVNFMIPGPPQTSLVLYFTPEDPATLAKKSSAFAKLFHEFFHGSDDANGFRSQRMKLIPRVVQGTWPIREGVGTTPAILGTKTYQKYFRGTQYIEVDYDIGSSMVAASLCKMLLGYSRDLIIDLAFVLEGQSREELPERVLGCVRLDCVDLRHAVQYKPTAPQS